MQGENIEETFKATIVLAEVLNRLSINTEILGFNRELYTYQEFGQAMSQDIRKHMSTMPQETNSNNAAYNDDGWALQETSQRLKRQLASEKFIIVLSDGEPAESSTHPKSAYDLQEIINNIIKNTDQKLIGLGVGPDTEHVETYYPNSVADIDASEMPQRLTEVIEEVIANYNTF
jgi:cobalamin biosynthesis protein CobT